MLLELLQHHPGLLLTAIEPLIWRRDCRSLGALGASCRQIREFLAQEVPLTNHYKKYKNAINDIHNNIHMVCDNYTSIHEFNNNLFIYEHCWSLSTYIEILKLDVSQYSSKMIHEHDSVTKIENIQWRYNIPYITYLNKTYSNEWLIKYKDVLTCSKI